MVTSVDEWKTFPSHFWIHGGRPDKLVDFDERLNLWNIYGFQEAVEVLSNPQVFSNDTGRLDATHVPESIMEGDFAAMDPPKHGKVRGLVDHAFKPRLVATLAAQIDQLVGELLDELADRERFDLVTDFSLPLPVIVISELLGVPSADRALIHDWMHRLLDGVSDFEPMGEPPPQATDPQQEELERLLAPLREMQDYWTSLAADRKRRPREDLLTHLLESELAGERLNGNQVANIANRLLIAGHHSTSILIGNAVLCLNTFPDQAARVRADPSLMPTMIEETLRYLSPISGVMRCTNVDAEVAGERIPKDQFLMVWTGAANRDTRRFDDPDTYDVGRRPNAHLGFGWGTHFCLGRPLARMEGRAAVKGLLERFPGLRTDPDNSPTFYQIVDSTGVSNLPVLTD